MTEIPEAFLSHKTNNRVRIKIPSKKRDIGYFNFVGQKLLECDGLNKIKVNPLSGSILIEHTTTIRNILEYAHSHKIFSLSESYKPFDLHGKVTKIFRDLDRHFQKITGGSLDIADFAFLSLFVLGIYQLSKGNITAPAWYTAFWYALGIFLKSSKKNNNLT